jgi:phosphoribosyl 1,2-cyclic phosphate phosphodiesterase
MGLFQMRWGRGKTIPVFCPRDKQGCADLYKNSGLFHFEPFKKIFTPVVINGAQPSLTVSAIPLNHSKETLGYCIEGDGKKLAYLCDTKGLPAETAQYLLDWRPHHIIIDCTFAPNSDEETQNHNSYHDVLDIRKTFIDHGIDATYSLTHIGHDMDVYLMNQWSDLPIGVTVAEDGQVFSVDSLNGLVELAVS